MSTTAPTFWDHAAETLPREQLRALQLQRLQATVARVADKVPFYKNKFAETKLAPADIRSLDDLRRLPFTTNADLRANYPDGMLSVPREKVVRVHTSSGTTGKPKAIFFSAHDINNAAELMARCLTMAGIGAGDVLQNMMTYGLFTGALMVHYGAEKIGAIVVPAGPGNSDRQLMLMQDFRTTVVHMTPSYALYFGELLKQKGIDPRRDLALKKALVGAESYTPATRAKIEATLGVTLHNNYGLSEMNGPGVAFDCAHQTGLHIWEDNYIAEIIDPATGENLPDGESGELVLTTLCREAMPILRYRTRDITRIISEPCPCGRTHRKIAGITGRSDDMLIVRGVNIYPQQIEAVLMSTPGLGGNYLITLSGTDEMLVQVELAETGFDGQVEHLVKLQNRITEKIRSETLVKPSVELVQPGTLPVAEGKAKRVIDNRTL